MTAWTTRVARGVVLLGLIVAVLAQAALFRSNTSAANDEQFYLRLGMDVYGAGSFSQLCEWGVAPLPVLITGWPVSRVARSYSDAANGLEAIRVARLATTIVVGVPLVLLVYGWTTRRRGALAGAVAGSLVAFSPNLIAASAMATTDLCFVLFALVALAALAWYARGPSLRRLLAVAGAVGLALTAKYTAVFLFLVSFIVFATIDARARARGAGVSSVRLVLSVAGRAAAHVALLVLVAGFVAWIFHGFYMAPVVRTGEGMERLFGSGRAGTLVVSFVRSFRVPAPIFGFAEQAVHVHNGNEAFLLGQRSSDGWWSFFPLAFLLKSTPVEIALGLGLGWLLLCGRRDLDIAAGVWALALAVFVPLAIVSRLNLGLRYILLVYPLIILIAVDLASVRWMRRPAGAGIAVAFVGLQAWSAMGVAPHYLSYFNSFAGGPSAGYRYLVDANLDWGQDLPSLKDEIDRVGARRVVLAYFGINRPDVYGVHGIKWDDADAMQLADGDWIAISATNLQGLYLRGDPFARFRAIRPDARAGYSIFLYRLDREEVRAALEAARMLAT